MVADILTKVFGKRIIVLLPCFVYMHKGCDLREMVLWDKTECLALMLSLQLGDISSCVSLIAWNGYPAVVGAHWVYSWDMSVFVSFYSSPLCLSCDCFKRGKWG